MKKILLKSKSLLVMAGLCVGASAWAYEVPEGYEVKNVFYGTLADGVVSPETFNDVTANDIKSQWDVSELYSNTVGTFAIASVEEVANVEVGETLEDGVVPTYVSGNTIRISQRGSSGNKYATLNFAEVSSGILVLTGDIFLSGGGDNNTADGPRLRLLDSDGNNVFAFGFNSNSGNQRFSYNIGDGATTNATTIPTTTPRTYIGWGVKELSINFNTGALSLTIDYITSDKVRTQQTLNLNIGTGKSVSKFQFGRAGRNKVDANTHLDNFSLYTVGPEAGNYTYTVKAKAGDTDLGQIATGECKGGLSFSVSGLHKMLSDSDGKYYVLNDDGVSSYKKTFIMGDDDTEVYVNYVLDESIVAFVEGEDGKKDVEEKELSGGAIGAIDGQNKRDRGLSMGTLEAGVYNLVMYTDGTQYGRGLKLRDKQNPTTAIAGWDKFYSSNFNKENSVSFTLIQPTSLVLNGSDSGTEKTNQSTHFDYAYIQKVADLPATIDIADNGVGYATFSSDYNLDFTGSDVKAYVATEAADGEVKMEPVTTVPAKTGLFLKGSGTVSVTGEAVEAPTTNLLKATTGATVAATDADNGVYHYVFAKQGDDLGFYNLGTPLEMAAGKAYLETAESIAPANSARVALVFADDETTGISDYNRATTTNGRGFYDLQGRRVAQPAKGMYIANGKKYINK